MTKETNVGKRLLNVKKFSIIIHYKVEDLPFRPWLLFLVAIREYRSLKYLVAWE